MRAERLLRHTIMEDVESPKFTVNQIVLLQKLKQTGLTKLQILKGLEEMEKLEDIGLCSPGLSNTPSSVPSVSSPSSHCSGGSLPNGTSQPVVTRENEVHRSSTSPSSPRVKYNAASTVAHPLTQPNPLIFGTHLQNPSQLSLLSPVGTWPNTSQAVAVATAAAGLFQNGFAHGHVPPVYSGLLNGRVMPRGGSVSNPGGSTVVEIDDEKVDITEELEELFRRDQVAVKEDIRKFIGERHISQSAIAKATKNAISQSYISQWLAQPQDISGQKKKAMYTWFITEKRRSTSMSNGLNHSQPVSYRAGEMDQDINPLLLKSKRGARFTWPKECLSILESYYNSNSYPDECKREEIAHACNSIIQAQKPGGIILSDLDKVTTVKVYNWFANRRKDDKRRRHIEHIEAMGQQQSMLSPRRSSNASPSPSCNSNDSHPEEDSAFVVNDKVTAVVKREHPSQIAMEMAAVNSSILALVNPHRNSISHDEEYEEEEHDATAFERSQEHKQPYHQSRAECRSFVA